MHHRSIGPRLAPARLALLALVPALALAACAGAAGPSPSPSPAPVKLTVGLGYIPSVQFAQFYLAQQAGYYRDAGLDVTFQNKIDPELVTLVGQGAIDIGLADGTSLIPAVSQGIPVRYVASIYARFPNIVFAKASAGIATAADLKGKKLGIPGKYGSSWIMLQALLQSAGLKPDDLQIVAYPDYSQGAAVARGQVDAATGFVNNEPVQLALQGMTPVILHVDGAVPLPGNGLIVGTQTLAAKSDALRAFVAATLRAEAEISADPQKGLDAAIAVVPDLAQARDTQLAILKATIETWSPYTDAHGLGAIDRDGWQRTIDFMSKLPGGLVPNPVTVDQLVSGDLLPK